MEGIWAFFEIKMSCYLKEIFSQSTTLITLLLMAFLDSVTYRDEDSARSTQLTLLLPNVSHTSVHHVL